MGAAMTGKAKKIFAIISAFVIGVFAVVFGSRELIHSRQLATRGKMVTGEVLDTEDHVSGRLHWHTYYALLLFQPETAETIRKRVTVSKAVYLAAQTNDSVRVFYLAEDPSICAAGNTVE